MQITITIENKFQWDGYQFHPYDVHHQSFTNWCVVQSRVGPIGNQCNDSLMIRCDEEKPSSTGDQTVESIVVNFGWASVSCEEKEPTFLR